MAAPGIPCARTRGLDPDELCGLSTTLLREVREQRGQELFS